MALASADACRSLLNVYRQLNGMRNAAGRERNHDIGVNANTRPGVLRTAPSAATPTASSEAEE